MPGRCSGFIACSPLEGFPDEMKIPSGQDACYAVLLTCVGWTYPAVEPWHLWGGTEVLGGFLLGSTPAQGLPLIFNVLGFGYLPWAVLVTVNALG